LPNTQQTLSNTLDESLPVAMVENIGRIRDCVPYFVHEAEERVLTSSLGNRGEPVEKPSASDQFVFDGAAGCRAAGRDAELAVDRAQMGIGCARTDDKLFGDLGVGQPLRHKA
jgi:hypothetical protein